MARPAHTSQAPRSAMLRPAVLILGLALATTGVALNEGGVSAGRALLVVGLALALVGAGWLFWARAAGEQQAISTQPPADRWPEVAALAQRVGLTVEGRKARGEHNGRRVSVSLADPGQRAVVRAFLGRKLDMGLTIARGQMTGDARKRVLSGEATFDAAYTVRADESKRAQLVLTERLRDLLVPEDANIDDERVVVRAEPSQHALAHALRAAVKAAAEVERVTAPVPCARPVRDSAAAWQAFAEEHKLATASTPLSMWGELCDVHVLAIAVRDAFENFHFEISASFPQALDRGLTVRPASAATALDRSGEPLGLPAFDKLFVVKTKDPADTVRLINPRARKMLIGLRDRGLQVRADDAKLWAWVGLNRAAPELVSETLLELAQLASEVFANAARLPSA